MRLVVAADRLGRGHEHALPVAYRAGEMAALGEDRDLGRFQRSGVRRCRHQREADLLTRLEVLGREDRCKRLDDLLRLDRLGVDLVEQAHQGVAAPDRQRLHLGAGEQILEVVILLGGLFGRFADHGRVR